MRVFQATGQKDSVPNNDLPAISLPDNRDQVVSGFGEQYRVLVFLPGEGGTWNIIIEFSEKTENK